MCCGISDLRRRIHTQGNGLHGRGTASHAAERYAAHVQGRFFATGQKAASKTVATSLDDRYPRRDNLRPWRVPQFHQELAGRAADLPQRRGSDVAQLAR